MLLLERDHLMGELQALLDGAGAGCGGFAFVGGEAGVGKTALLDAFAGHARARATVWWGHCDALHTPSPLAPLRDMRRQMGAAQRERLRLDAPRIELFSSLLDVAATAPTVLVFEDVHWADEATLDLLRYLGRRVRRTPVLVLASHRDDEVGAEHPLRVLFGDLASAGVRRLAMSPLSLPAVMQLVGERAVDACALHARTGGNPFFVTEVLAGAADELPPTVRDAVLARLQRAGPAARSVLQLVAIVPGAAERWLIKAVAADAGAGLAQCLGQGLLVTQDQAVRYRHEIARQAADQALDPQQRRELHARVLAALSARGDGVALARLVHHAVRAGDAAAVCRHAPAAAAQAAAEGAHREAAAFYAAALAHAHDLPPRRRAELLDAEAYQCYLTGAMAQAVACREQALLLWRALGDRLREGDDQRWLSRQQWFLGDRARADAHALASIRLLEALPPGPELAMAYSNKAQLHMLAEELQPCLRWGERAIALAGQLQAAEIESHALNNVGAARLRALDLGGRAALERSLAIALEHGLEEHAARAYCNLSSVEVQQRVYARAQRYLSEGLGYCAERDLDSWSLYLQAWQARAHLELGRWDAAAELALPLVQRVDVPAITRIPALAVLAAVRVRRGDPGSAALLDEGRALALPTDELQRIGPVAEACAEAAWWAGDAAACIDATRLGIELAQRHANPWALGALALWAWRAGAPGMPPAGVAEPHALQMTGRWAEAAAQWRELGCPYEEALALADGDDAAQRQALALLDRLGAAPAAAALRRTMRERGSASVPRGPRSSTLANACGLTVRQLDVLALLAEGLSNAQIGQRRHLSVRTVDHHVAAILAKLGASSRADAVQRGRAAGLLGPN